MPVVDNWNKLCVSFPLPNCSMWQRVCCHCKNVQNTPVWLISQCLSLKESVGVELCKASCKWENTGSAWWLATLLTSVKRGALELYWGLDTECAHTHAYKHAYVTISCITLTSAGDWSSFKYKYNKNKLLCLLWSYCISYCKFGSDTFRRCLAQTPRHCQW